MRHLKSEIRTFAALYDTQVDPQTGNVGTGIFLPVGYQVLTFWATCVTLFGVGGVGNFACDVTLGGVSFIGGTFFDVGDKPAGFTYLASFPTNLQTLPPSSGQEVIFEIKGDPFINGQCQFLISAMVGVGIN